MFHQCVHFVVHVYDAINLFCVRIGSQIQNAHSLEETNMCPVLLKRFIYDKHYTLNIIHFLFYVFFFFIIQWFKDTQYVPVKYFF